MGVLLSKLVSTLGIGPWSVPPVDILGVTSDSRQVKTGYLFVAIPGTALDGHDYIPEAVRQGARAVVAERQVTDCSCPLVLVSDSRQALAQLAACYWNQPSKRIKLIGITGTNGKTTTAYMLNNIFGVAGRPTGVISTLEVKYGSHTIPAQLTTPVADSLQQYLAQMAAEELEVAVMEVSSQGINSHRIAQLYFDLGILTNITLDHLDTHANFLEYRETKVHFLNTLAPDHIVLINIDDLGARSILPELQVPYVSYGLSHHAQIRAVNIDLFPQTSSFLLTIDHPLSTHRGTISPLKLPLLTKVPGQHNIANALAAAAAALVYSVDTRVIQQGLATFNGVSRRLEWHRLAGFTVLDDTALNPASFDAVFESIAVFPYRRLRVVYALRGNRSPAVNRANAFALAWWAKRLRFHDFLTTCSHEYVGPLDRVSPEEEAAFFSALTAAGISPLHFSQLEPALKAILDRVEPGDLLLLLGAQGMDYGWGLLQRLFQEPEYSPTTYDRPRTTLTALV